MEPLASAFPRDAGLLSRLNRCPCGWLGSQPRECRCGILGAARYRARISGPLLDRFDLRVDVKPVDPSALLSTPKAAEPFDVSRLLNARRI